MSFRPEPERQRRRSGGTCFSDQDDAYRPTLPRNLVKGANMREFRLTL